MTKEHQLLSEIEAHFKKMQTIHLATVEGERPRLRPVTLIFHKQRFWIGTSTTDAKIEQIKSNPFIEFCLMLPRGDNLG